MKTVGFEVQAGDGFASLHKDRGAADRYAVACHAVAVEPLHRGSDVSKLARLLQQARAWVEPHPDRADAVSVLAGPAEVLRWMGEVDALAADLANPQSLPSRVAPPRNQT